MTIKPIYKFILANKTSITTYEKDIELDYPILSTEEKIAIIADDNKILTNGTIFSSCIFVDSTEGWQEIENPNLSEDNGEI